jgi:hypothetical protein
MSAYLEHLAVASVTELDAPVRRAVAAAVARHFSEGRPVTGVLPDGTLVWRFANGTCIPLTPHAGNPPVTDGPSQMES